jgi:hypothetical protein
MVSTVQESGWAGKKNGELLLLAAQGFEIFITVDRNLYFQQNVTKSNIAVLVLSAPTNRLADLKPLAPKVLAQLPLARRGEIYIISQ